MPDGREVWITGIGLVSNAGETEATLAYMDGASIAPIVDGSTFSPYPVHPLASIDFKRQIPKISDQRQMGRWQCSGVYAAGLALDDAGISHNATLLRRAGLVIAAGNGERDIALDSGILESVNGGVVEGAALNTALTLGRRPTLYLGELSNLLAGNISIVHHVTCSSRTFKGEETAGVAALENAVRRIAAGQGDLLLVGGALNAEREDLLLGYELGCNLWAEEYRPVWERGTEGGGFILGSVGAFLVLEAREHAVVRGREPYARISAVVSDRCRRGVGEISETMGRLFAQLPGDGGPLALLSGASGVELATSEERTFLAKLSQRAPVAVRAYGTRLGHSVEAHFPMGVALAALALKRGAFFPPLDSSGVEEPFENKLKRVLVSCVGHWRGEGLALIELGS